MLNRIKNWFAGTGNGIQAGPRPRRSANANDLGFDVETLENREMLAGDVKATFRNGDLVLRGDKLNNNVEVIQTTAGFRVIGLPDQNGASTTVNGLAFQDFSGPAFVADDVRISMKGGNDRAGVFLPVNGNVTMNMGSGGDLATIQSLVGGNLKIISGSSQNLLFDQVFVGNSTIVGKTVIRGGGGTQQVFLTNSQFNSANINLGGGNDLLDVNTITVGTFRANGGAGNADAFNVAGNGVIPGTRGFEFIS